MDNKRREKLQELITEGEYFTGEFSKTTKLSESLDQRYDVWITEVRVWTENNYKNKLTCINECINLINLSKTEAMHRPLINELKAMLKYPQKNEPIMNENKKESHSTNVFISQFQSQEQTQSQKLLQEVFLEAIKDELKGKQIKELQAILEVHKDDIEEAKPKLIGKLLSFGKDVASNIVANILTNPNIMGFFQ